MCAPLAIAGQPCSWAGVGAANELSNQARVGLLKTERASIAHQTSQASKARRASTSARSSASGCGAGSTSGCGNGQPGFGSSS